MPRTANSVNMAGVTQVKVTILEAALNMLENFRIT